MTLQPKEDTEDRLRAPDWQDKYRWPDPEIGWSGPLAGYPPDHPVRRGSKIALRLIARKYWADPLVTRYREWITGWPEEEDVTKTTPATTDVTKTTPATTDVTKTAVTKTLNVTKTTDVTKTPGYVTKTLKVGRPKTGQALTAAERKRASRAKDKPDLMVDAFAAALGKFEERAATETPDDDLPYEERVQRDRARKKATRELWAKTGKP